MKIIKKNPYFRRSAFLIIMFFLIVSVSIFSFTTSNVNSLIILLPFSVMIMAFFIVLVTENIGKIKNGKIISKAILASVLIFLLVGNIVLINEYKAEGEKRGGTRNYSMLYSQAGNFILEQNYTKITILDVSLMATIYVSTEGKVDVTRNILYDNQNERWLKSYDFHLRRTLNDPDMVFVKFNDDFNLQSRKNSHIVNEVLESENKEFVTLKSFKNSNGNELIYIFKAKEKG